jgi:anti-anti-sigma factor
MFRTLLRRWSKPFTRSERAGQSPSRAPRLEVVVCVCAHEIIVGIKGEAHDMEAGTLEAALRPVEARRPPLVTFDLSELHYLSSVLLGMLVAYRHGSVRRGGRVRLLGLQPNVRETIERARLTSLFEEVDPSEVLKDRMWA